MGDLRSTLPPLWEDLSNVFLLAPLHRQVGVGPGETGRTAVPPPATGSFDFAPPAEVHDAEAQLTIRIELPGIDAEDVVISATDRLIDVKGEKRSETERRAGDHYATERGFGAFERSFSLPYAIDPGRVEAKLDRGVLTLRVDKPAGSGNQARRIRIDTPD